MPQAKLETVLKVSQNRPQEEEEEEEAAAQLALSPIAPGSLPTLKVKEKQHREQPVESEVDRIIDAQDNEYVLSRPKYAPGRSRRGCHFLPLLGRVSL